MELLFIKWDCPEWDYIWEWLGKHPNNIEYDEPTVILNDGENWQYMGSYRNEGEVVHHFRHRNHPRKGRYYLYVIASEAFKEEDIEKIIKM